MQQKLTPQYETYRAKRESSNICYAHKLKLNYASPCTNFHGHNSKCVIEIGVKGLSSDALMVVDFNKLGSFLNAVHSLFDHATVLTSEQAHFLAEKHKTPFAFEGNEESEAIGYAISSFGWFGKVLILPKKYSNSTSEVLAHAVQNYLRLHLSSIIPNTDNVDYINVEWHETDKNIASCLFTF